MVGLLLMLQAGNSFAQVTNGGYQKTLEFLQGNGVVDEGPMVFLEKLRHAILPIFDIFIADAQALAAVFMIIFFAVKSYEMMSGDKNLEVMPLLRPFGLLMIIFYWGTFTQIVAYPTEIIAEKAQDKLKDEQQKVNHLRNERIEYVVAVKQYLISAQVDAMIATDEAKGVAESKGFWSSLGGKFKDYVLSPIYEYSIRFELTLKMFVAQLLELMALWVFRTAVFILFMIQIIYASILAVLGPFAVAASILPAFRDSLTTWIARFISVNLYIGIGYIVMMLCAVFQHYAMEVEISRYQELMGPGGTNPNEAALAVYATEGVLSFGTLIITYLTGAVCILTVPSISTWIISTSGISSAVSTMGRSGGQGAAAARRAITKV